MNDLEKARRALREEESHYGVRSLEAARAIERVGAVELAWQLPTEALESFERALAILESLVDGESPEVGELLGNIGLALRELGRRRDAERYIRRAVDVLTTARGPDDPSVGRAMGDLGALFLDEDPGKGVTHGSDQEERVQMSLELLKRARATFSDEEPDERRAIAQTDASIGLAHFRIGELDSAITSFTEAKKRFAIIEGLDGTNVAQCKAMVGAVMIAKGDLEGARVELEEALAVQDHAIATDPRVLANTMGNLALVLAAAGEMERAERLQADAIVLWDSGEG